MSFMSNMRKAMILESLPWGNLFTFLKFHSIVCQSFTTLIFSVLDQRQQTRRRLRMVFYSSSHHLKEDKFISCGKKQRKWGHSELFFDCAQHFLNSFTSQLSHKLIDPFSHSLASEHCAPIHTVKIFIHFIIQCITQSCDMVTSLGHY